MKKLESTITLDKSQGPSKELLAYETHNLRAYVGKPEGEIHFHFSTRLAMYEFGKSLMREALHGHGSMEMYPLKGEGTAWLVVSGVRMIAGSPRLFFECGE